jgi:murein DD-endopeptidase MepM/ murein hydrolase activator NlpD
MVTKLILLSLSIIFITSCASVSVPTIKSKSSYNSYSSSQARPQIKSHQKSRYTIRRGDSLWSIAKKYNLKVSRIVSANPGLNPKNLKIGKKINIPRYKEKTSNGFIWPIKGEILNSFGEKVDGSRNNGINFISDKESSAVFASSNGKAIFSDHLKGWGKTIILAHNQNVYTIYANLGDPAIKEGAYAKKGEKIAQVVSGKNGNHVLHFEVRKRSVPQNPLTYIN